MTRIGSRARVAALLAHFGGSSFDGSRPQKILNGHPGAASINATRRARHVHAHTRGVAREATPQSRRRYG